jgi:hypothetical protein
MYLSDALRGPSGPPLTNPANTLLLDFDREAHWTMQAGDPFTFMTLVRSVTELSRVDFDGLDALLANLRLRGDWIVRKGTSTPARLEALASILNSEFGRHIRLVPRTVERDVIVARGVIEIRPLPGEGHEVAIYLNARSGDGQYHGWGSASTFLGDVGDALKIKMINETTAPSNGFQRHQYIKPEETIPGNARDQFLKNISDQTGMTFTFERRPIEVWFVEPSTGTTETSEARQ